jgi:hypothetical protein
MADGEDKGSGVTPTNETSAVKTKQCEMVGYSEASNSADKMDEEFSREEIENTVLTTTE